MYFVREHASLFLQLRTYGLGIQHYPRWVNTRLNLHGIDVVLITFIVHGRCRHIMEDGAHWAVDGSVGITHYGQTHDILTDDSKGVDHYNLFLDPLNYPLPVLPEELQDAMQAILPLHPNFMLNPNRRVHLVLDDPESAATWLRTIQHEIETKDAGHEEVIAANFRLFLIACCRQALKSGVQLRDHSRNPSKARLERLRQYLDTSFANPMTLDDLSQRSELSPTYLCRAFKAYTGKPIFDYLQVRRIQACMTALRNTDEKILTIAMANGFTELAHFNHKFKKLVGITPSAYREYQPANVGGVI